MFAIFDGAGAALISELGEPVEYRPASGADPFMIDMIIDETPVDADLNGQGGIAISNASIMGGFLRSDDEELGLRGYADAQDDDLVIWDGRTFRVQGPKKDIGNLWQCYLQEQFE